MYDRLVRFIKNKLSKIPIINNVLRKPAAERYLNRIVPKLANVVGLLKTAAIFSVLTFLIFAALLTLWLGDDSVRAEAIIVISVLLIIFLSFKRYKRRSAPRAYNVFITVRYNSQDYGCAIPCRRNIFDVNKAYCPLNSIELKRLHGYDETISLDGVFLVLKLAESSPCIRVDILGAILGSRDKLQELPDRLRFDFKTEAGGDAAAVKRIKARLECDKVYDVTYGGHELRILIYNDISKETLLSRGGFII